MYRVRRLVGGGQGLDGPSEFADVEGGHGASGSVHHRRGQVGREVTAPCHRLVDGLPAAHRVEAGLRDPMNGTPVMHLLVKRIRILDVVIVEQGEAERAIHRGHGYRLSGADGPRQ